MTALPSVSFEWARSYKIESTETSFLDLPRELRDQIYQYALTVPGAILVQSQYLYSTSLDLEGRVIRYKDEGPFEPQRVSNAIAIGLTRVCRQLHAESAAVLYGRNTFSFQMSNADFATSYRTLIHYIVFTMEGGRGIYNEDMEVMSYWWRRVFWPNIIDRSSRILLRYPNLKMLTLPIRSDRADVTWRPPFMAIDHKTSEQRVAMGARWLRQNCPMRDPRLREILHLEIQVPSIKPLLKSEFEGSRFAFEEETDDEGWNYSQFALAFERMKNL